MIPTCQTGVVQLAQASDLHVPEVLLRWMETTSFSTYLVLIAVGAIGLFLGWLLGRIGKKTERSRGERAKSTHPELEWRHEKLVLLERQDAEKLTRAAEFVESICRTDPAPSVEISSRFFRLDETIRNIRQRVGTDLSRTLLVEERLSKHLERGASRPDAISACLEISESQRKRLETVRDKLRPLSAELLKIDDLFHREREISPPAKSELTEKLEAVRKTFSEIPSDWQILTDEADRQIRDLLGAGGEEEFEPIRNVLLIDGAVTESLTHSDDCPVRKDIDRILDLLEDSDDPAGNGSPFEKEFAVAKSPAAMIPDSGFRPPESDNGITNGNRNRDLSPEKIEKPEAMPLHPPLILFRSNDVSIWGENVYRGANSRSRELESPPGWANWISIRRVDTGETVYAPYSSLSFSNRELEAASGFNGSNELFYGARHLGMYSDSVPNEVETRFTYGGWGFGHRVDDAEDPGDSLQASGWEGREIPYDTVFEIALHDQLPELDENDRVLEPEESVIAR